VKHVSLSAVNGRARLLGLDRPAGEADKPDLSAFFAALSHNENGERRVYDA